MFKKVVETMEKANVRAKLKSGELACPDCGAAAGEVTKNWDEVMVCGSCGSRASLSEWASSVSGQTVGFADRPPANTKIRREPVSADQVIWHIPATGKFGFFLFFAIFWLLITGAVSGSFLFAFLTGGKIEGDVPTWVLIPFFAIFWAVGLGMLYAAFRQKYLKHTVTFGMDQITLRKEMFGKTSQKSLARSSISSVSQKEFYQQNYKPVYGIEIRGVDGKLRFGSGLTSEEKGWLVADFNQVLSGKKKIEFNQTTEGLAPILVGSRKSVFSVKIPKPGASALMGSLVFAMIGIGFVCIGIFAMEGESLPKDQQKAGGAFLWFHYLLANGFRTIWILFCSMFAVIGVGMTFSTLRSMKKDQRIEGNEAQISIRTYRNGLILEDRSFPRNQVHDIRGTASGSSNNKQMKRVELIVGNKTEKIANWMDGDMADQLIAEVREALGK
ncbi:MAG: hypothetical protein V4727_10155 [Verrucomicrobiota bacterium]